MDDRRTHHGLRRHPTETAALLMTEYGIHHLPVVDGQHPIGMIGLRAATGLP
jgi:CBS domain-containing protein